MRTLAECLLDRDITLLRAIAERRGVELGSGSLEEKAKLLSVALLEPDSVDETLRWLSDKEREALGALVANDGRMRAHRFALRFGEIRRFGPARLTRETPWRQPANPAEGLWYMGLIARAFAEQEGTMVEFVFVPSDLMPLLPPLVKAPAPFEVPPAADPHRVAAGDPALIDDLCTLLSSIQVGNDLGRVYEDDAPDAVERLGQRFFDRDSNRVRFLLHMARSAELVGVQGKSVVLSRESVRQWLKKPRAEQLEALQQTWLKDASWNDLCHVPGLRCEETGWRNDPLLARREVLGLLRRCSLAWMSISEFVDAVRDRVPDYARPDGDFESWYIRDARSGEYLVGFEHWDQVEGALLNYMISGPLHWLGVLSLGYKEGWEKPSTFRITPWGAAWLGFAPSPVEDLSPEPAMVSPDCTVTLSREAPLSDRFQLARIAGWQSSGAEYVYRLTPASVGRSLSAGIEVERIERFLKRISDDHVPAATILRLRGWAERYGRVRLRRVVILEARTPQVMADLRAHDRIRGYLRQAVSSTTALVRESDWDLLMHELYQAGYLPEISDR